MRFAVLAEPKGKIAQKVIASPFLSTDWGTRFLSSDSKHYNPISYNNGAVWPFLSGFSAHGLYNYGNPFHGFQLLEANIQLIPDHDYGAATELLSGEIYRPLDQSVPNQIWSSGNTISAFVEGLLGFSADALEKKVTLKPAIPLIWNQLQVKRLKIGQGSIDFKYKKNKRRFLFTFNLNNLPGFKIDFKPIIPALNETMVMNGRTTTLSEPIVVKSNRERFDFDILTKFYIYPYVPKNLKPGDFSTHPIIEDFHLTREGGILTLWGKNQVSIQLISNLPLKCSQGTCTRKGEITTLNLEYPQQWQKKTINCRIVKNN